METEQMFLLNFFLYSSRTLTKQAKQEKKRGK